MGLLADVLLALARRTCGRALLARAEAAASFAAFRRLAAEIDDAGALALALRSGRLRRAIRPALLDGPKGKRILVYAPHQDDETIAAAGTLRKRIKAGAKVKIIYVTDGAAKGKPGQVEDLAATRRQEAIRAWAELGGETPEFWDLPCRGIPLDAENAGTMRRQIEDFDADCVFAPFFLEPPRDHRRVCSLLLMAHRGRPLPEHLEIWCYQVSSMLAPNVVVDITEEIGVKDRINALWASQNVQFNYVHYARGLAAANTIYFPGRTAAAPGERYAEVFMVLKAQEYAATAAHFLEVASEALPVGAEPAAS